ncbi:MAG TPA: efflux RND transporter periplasmic adaptor subunit, partial [Longimicrobiales bacterium]|nr:efflux RND transporter periplasmic adaptor subunit [Longimicrobiales bacterium]
WLVRDHPMEVRVITVAVRGGPAGASGLTANGYVVARTKASVSSKLAGRLASLAVEEGDRVAAGAVIGQLEAAEYEALVRQARAAVLEAEAARLEADAQRTQAHRDLERARTLAADSLISPQALQDAGTAVEVAQARLEAANARLESARQGQAAAQANLENTRIRAPFSGTVLRKDAEVGEVVAPSVAGGGLTRGAVVTMADLSTLEVEVDVNEAYIATVAEDGPADIVLDAYPGERFPGHVRQIVPTADRQKATVLVRVAIDSEDVRILPEMGARVVFREEAREGPAEPLPARIFIPATAARTEGGETVVYLMVEGRARRRVVEAGPVSGEEREVRSGLEGGETLIVDPPAELADEARVRAVGDDPDEGRE